MVDLIFLKPIQLTMDVFGLWPFSQGTLITKTIKKFVFQTSLAVFILQYFAAAIDIKNIDFNLYVPSLCYFIMLAWKLILCKGKAFKELIRTIIEQEEYIFEKGNEDVVQIYMSTTKHMFMLSAMIALSATMVIVLFIIHIVSLIKTI